MTDERLLGEMLNAPLTLLGLKDQDTIDYFNNLLPYSVGFEIECDQKFEYNEECFTLIPDIMAVSNSICEQRYRIPNGIRGIICLYNITLQLAENSLLNFGSGIHYHIDCTDGYKKLSDNDFLLENEEWLLEELDTWEYAGSYNGRGISAYRYTGTVGAWIRLQPEFQTFEFRIGEMTFDYPVLLKRMMHLCSIMKRLKDKLEIPPPTFEAPDKVKIITHFKSQLVANPQIFNRIEKLRQEAAKLKEELKPKPIETDLPPIRKRIHRINNND